MAQIDGEYGQRLRAARRGRGLTLRQLADAAGVDFTSISHLEHGRFMPSVQLGQAFTDVLGVDLLPPGELAEARARIAQLEEKAAQLDRLREVIGDGQALVWYDERAQRLAAHPLPPGLRVVRDLAAGRAGDVQLAPLAAPPPEGLE